MRLLLTITLLSLISFSQAQELSAGADFGSNTAWISRPDSSGYLSVRSRNVNAFFIYEKNHLLAKSYIGYIQKGFGQNVIFVDTAGTFLGSGGPERHYHQYIDFNVSAGYTYGDKVYFYAIGGFSASYYLKTMIKLNPVPLNNGTEFPGYVVNQSDLTSMDLALTGEAAVGFKLNSGNSILLMSSYNHGLMNVGYAENNVNPWKSRCWTFRIGLRCHIEKKDHSSTTSPEGTDAPPNS